MKSTLFIFALLVSVCPAAFAKPNILLIYTDDQGWADLGLQGVDGDIRTPHLDQLTRDGVRFTRGYVTAPQCLPSRCGVITGRYQQKFGVEDNRKGPLPLPEVTIAERLKPAGYLSGFVGKYGFDGVGEGGSAKKVRLLTTHMPQHQGFDEYWRGERNAYYASHALDGTPFADAPRLVIDDRFRVVVQTEAALSFLDRRAKKPEQPWFLFLAWFAPHVPLESPEPWFSKTPQHLPMERRQALAMMAAMDDGLGEIRAQLKAMGAEKNTLIFFISDNGAPVRPDGWDGSLNKPLIGEKGMLTDGGVRVPFVAAWPGTIPAGQTYDHPVINLDVAATANALAGLPSDSKLDGVNLLPFLTGESKAAPHDYLYWRWRSQSAVLEFPWKLIHLGDQEKFLFDVTEPDGELAVNDQLVRHPDIAARLEAKLQTWSATLQPPGAPEKAGVQDYISYTEHLKLTGETKSKFGEKAAAGKKAAPAAPDSIQGWVCRNGTLAVKDGALRLTPDATTEAPTFLTRIGFDLPGPVTLTVRARGITGSQATVNWRSSEEKEFTAGSTATFDWPGSNEWQDVKVTLPIKGRLIHLRLTPPKTSTGLEIQSIELRGTDNSPQMYRFDH
ncbi:MAG TPA: sulfatase-like hydrolase/transferase [Pirellulales bacterium]|nr:sulfatase-like hydrolase/transferase [Pirellulales bacterium]